MDELKKESGNVKSTPSCLAQQHSVKISLMHLSKQPSCADWVQLTRLTSVPALCSYASDIDYIHSAHRRYARHKRYCVMLS